MSATNRTFDSIWVISEGRYTRFDLGRIIEDGVETTVREFRISDLARYMIDPKPVEVKKRLVGCEVYPSSSRRPVRDRLAKLLRRPPHPGDRQKAPSPATIAAIEEHGQVRFQNPDLEAHMEEIAEMVRPYDPILSRVQSVDPAKTADIVGICREPGGHRSMLTLQGSVSDKLAYMTANLFKEVPVVIERSKISEGLFEMSGFDFSAFDPRREFRLLKFRHGAGARCCVLRPSGRLDFWVQDPRLTGYLQLLQESLDADPQLGRPFSGCSDGSVRAVKIFFNTALSIDYSKAYLPPVYRELLRTHPVGPESKKAVIDSISQKQLGVAFNYIPESEAGEEKLYTNLSVMHDVSALEPIRDALPRIYAEVSRRASVSEAGRFYLLDSIKGYRYE